MSVGFEQGLMSEVENACWLEQCQYEQAESKYQQYLVRKQLGATATAGDRRDDAATADKGAASVAAAAAPVSGEEYGRVCARLERLERGYTELLAMFKALDSRCSTLEGAAPNTGVKAGAVNGASWAAVHDDDDDDVDLFASDDDEDEDDGGEAERLKAERVKAYEAKKAKKPVLIAKSQIVLDVKPWSDETDMVEMERRVRAEVRRPGLVWGAAKLVPLAYGIRKLQIVCVVEDDKVGTDWLEESITSMEDLVQSVDVAAFNKV